MSLKHLKKLAKKEQVPEWVSNKNKSFEIYEAINNLSQEKLQYIKQHKLEKEYKRKKVFQITASEISRQVGLAVPTITSTSTYSDSVREYLVTVNSQLLLAKNKRIRDYKKSSRVHSQRKKKEILTDLKKVKHELSILKQKNANEQVDDLIAKLALPVRRKLGLG